MSWQTNNIHKKGEGDGKEGVGRERKSREQRSLYVALIVLILAINLAPDSATNPFFSLSPKTNGGSRGGWRGRIASRVTLHLVLCNTK